MSHTAKPVVVAINDKQPSALLFAIGEARSSQSPLRVVHTTGLATQSQEFYTGANFSMLESTRATGQAVLDDARHFIEDHENGLQVEYILSDQAPLNALEREASRARLLIVGADDVSWFERLLRTKIAGFLAKHAPCPVIVVPEVELPDGADGEITLTLDADTPAPGPLQFAFEEANARDCLLHVLHVTPPDALPAEADAARVRLAAIVKEWRQTYPDTMVLEGYATDDPETAIIRATQSADLVIVGRPHDLTLPLSISRPLAMKVLARAGCAVAVVPADYPGI